MRIADQTYYDIEMLDFLKALTERITSNNTALNWYNSKVSLELTSSKFFYGTNVPHHHSPTGSRSVWGNNFNKQMSDDPEACVTAQRMVAQIQNMVSSVCAPCYNFD